MKPIQNPVGCLFRRSINDIAQTVRSISQHPDPRCPRPTVVFKCGLHENFGIAHRVLCDPSKTAAQPAFTLDSACHNVVLPQAHYRLKRKPGANWLSASRN
jgi:hypothetical protein